VIVITILYFEEGPTVERNEALKLVLLLQLFMLIVNDENDDDFKVQKRS
jgi:hypothetical protein